MGGGGGDIKETPEQKELARIAAEQYRYFENELMPVRDVYIGEMKAGNDASKYERLSGLINTDTAAVMDREIDGGVKQLAANNIDPTSGKFQATVGNMAKEAGAITADTVNRGQVAQQDAYLSGLSNVIAMGEKKATQATAGLSDVAAQSYDHALQSKQNSLQKRGDVTTGLGMVAGAGLDVAMSDDKDGV